MAQKECENSVSYEDTGPYFDESAKFDIRIFSA